MNRSKIILSVLLTTVVLFGCWEFMPGSLRVYKNGQDKAYKATFSETPVPLSEFNTVYDDYNSALPEISDVSPFLFSTNRFSEGGQFDFILEFLDITFNYKKNSLTIGDAAARQYGGGMAVSTSLYQLTRIVNNDADQLGPFILPRAYGQKANYQPYLFLYSSSEEGSQDIRFTYNTNNQSFNPTKAVAFLNSASDDAYPVISQDSSSLYFCSNRDKNFDIYSVILNTSKGIVTDLESATPKPVVKETIFSSDADDKCPFFVGNFMVFTSNRPGGFGGFDLYYSVYKNGAWSVPVNFGNKINTSADEYRPIVKFMNGYDRNAFLNDFMIFSSNRAGGKGGFDLYYVGISQLRDNFVSEAALGLSNSEFH